MKTLSKVVGFERHDEASAEVLRLMRAGQYTEAIRLAAARLTELRTAWGYDGKTTTQQTYINTFARLRAEACRKLAGV